MTKKDFQLIAEVIKEEVEFWQRQHLPPPSGTMVLMSLAHTMAARLKAKNPQFHEQKFMAASGLG